MKIYNLDELNTFALEPEDNADFYNWILQEDIVPYLESEVRDEYIIIYASLPHTYMYTVLIPDIEPEEHILNDLLTWKCDPFSSWALTCSSDDAWIEEPLSSSSSNTLQSGEQIIFARSFDGDPRNNTYYELNQKIAHVLDIHFVEERNAWCKLDEHGDLEDIFKIFKINTFLRNETGTIVCVKKEVLGEYAGVENLKLIRMFDFSRYKSGDFQGWNDNRKHLDLSNSVSIFGTLSIVPESGSYSRGFQLIDIKAPKAQIVDNAWGRPKPTDIKQYCTYIADDWKNKIVSEISCNPSCLANYFTESNLPFEITPAFFKPEVLSKYKSDRAKYQLDTRSVGCRGSWHIKTFDINSAGQVHAYLIDLSHLPYEEQLHWKQFNERPKAPLSKRTIKVDFEGEFYDEYDPLSSLKMKLETLHTKGSRWWKLRDQDSPNKVHYPYTASRDEWAEEILNLDQLLVEGFEERWLRNKAKELDCNQDVRLRALKLTELILIAEGFEEDHAREIMSPFHTLHNLRSVLKGHTSGSEAEEIRKKSLIEFGSFRNHFEKLCANCDESLEIIIGALEEK